MTEIFFLFFGIFSQLLRFLLVVLTIDELYILLLLLYCINKWVVLAEWVLVKLQTFFFSPIDWCYNRLIPPLVLLSPLTFLTIFLIDDDYWIVIAATLIELTYIFAINWSITFTFFLDFFFISLSDSTEFHEIGRRWRREKGCIFFFFWQIAPYPKISTIPHSIFLFSN